MAFENFFCAERGGPVPGTKVQVPGRFLFRKSSSFVLVLLGKAVGNGSSTPRLGVLFKRRLKTKAALSPNGKQRRLNPSKQTGIESVSSLEPDSGAILGNPGDFVNHFDRNSGILALAGPEQLEKWPRVLEKVGKVESERIIRFTGSSGQKGNSFQSHPFIFMNNEIALLAQFLESLGPEVSGHSASPLTPEQIEKIQQFASGKLGPAERQQLLPSILENETALHTLVRTLEDRP